MSFIIIVLILIWAVAWPVLSYFYVKAQFGTPAPTPEGPKRITSRDLKVTPLIEGDKTVVMLKMGGHTYLGDDRDITDLLRRVKATQMTARTMNEVQELER